MFTQIGQPRLHLNYDLLTNMRTYPTMIERRRNITAAMMLTLEDCIDFWLLSPLNVSSPLFSKQDLDAEEKGTATSQKDLVTVDGGSISGSKIAESSVGASIDNNSTHRSLRT